MSALTETRFIDGTTSEGYPFNLQLRFRIGTPEGEMPIEVACWYQASDGPSTVVLDRSDAGLYAYADSDSISRYGDVADANPNILLPAVVTDGTWGGQQS